VSTEQILHPERFAPGQEDMPTVVQFGEALPDGWTEVLTDDLGELETRLLLREFLSSRRAADRGAAGWDGDRFRLLDGPNGEDLLWVTVWDTDRDALEFETAVREALTRRYDGDPRAADREIRIARGSESQRPVVIVWDLAAGSHDAADLDSMAEFELDELSSPRPVP
jgi:hypothetical protein